VQNWLGLCHEQEMHSDFYSVEVSGSDYGYLLVKHCGYDYDYHLENHSDSDF